MKKLGPIYYKRCEGAIKTTARKYSVSFKEDSKIPQDQIESIQKLMQQASTDTLDKEALQEYPWSENQLIGIVSGANEEELFLHYAFNNFNPYLANWGPNWPPEELKEKYKCIIA